MFAPDTAEVLPGPSEFGPKPTIWRSDPISPSIALGHGGGFRVGGAWRQISGKNFIDSGEHGWIIYRKQLKRLAGRCDRTHPLGLIRNVVGGVLDRLVQPGLIGSDLK